MPSFNIKTVLCVIATAAILLVSLAANFETVKWANADTASSSPATWNEVFGGTGNYEVSSLVNTSDGGYAIAGNINGTATLLIKTDSKGSVQWSKTYEGLGCVHVHSMIQTSDGGYMLAGGTAANATANSNDWFCWVVKTDSSGNQDWSKTYSQPTTSEVYSVIQTSDGGYALVGSATYGNPATYGDGTVALLVKTDSSGTLKWNQTYSGSGWAYADSIIQTSDGGYALAGTTNPIGKLAHDYWLVKTDAKGSMEWNKMYNDSSGAAASAIVRTSNGGYTLAGYVGSFGITNVWVVNVNSNGNELWTATWGNPQPIEPNCLIKTNDDGYVVTGYADSLKGFNGLQSYLFIFKLASDGNVRWDNIYSITEDTNSALYAVQTKDGNYVLAGTILSNTTGLQTIWFAKANSTGLVTAPLSNQTLTPQIAELTAVTLAQPAKSQSKGLQPWYFWAIATALAIVIILAVVRITRNKNHSSQPLLSNLKSAKLRKKN